MIEMASQTQVFSKIISSGNFEVVSNRKLMSTGGSNQNNLKIQKQKSAKTLASPLEDTEMTDETDS